MRGRVLLLMLGALAAQVGRTAECAEPSVNSTGELHRGTLEELSRTSPPEQGTIDLMNHSIAVSWEPFQTVREAASSESAIDWHRDSIARQESCTLSFAALELRHYLCRITKSDESKTTVLPFRSPLGRRDGNLIVITTLNSEQVLELYKRHIPTATLLALRRRSEGFAAIPLKEQGRSIILLIGSDRVGALYAVYDFLEKLGVRWLGLGEENEVMPDARQFRLPPAYVETPGFGFRALYAFRKNRGTEELFSWMAKNKMNAWGADNLLPGMRKRGLKLYGGNHWIQTEAGIKGYLCLSNSEQYDRFVANTVNQLAEGLYKDLDILEYLPGDWAVRCERDDSLGSPTDRDILLVHRLRKAIRAAYTAGRLNRDVPVFFYAYTGANTIAPPTRPMPQDFDYKNTSVGFYAERCFNHALNDPTCNESFVISCYRRPINAQLNQYLKLWTNGTTSYQGQVGFGDYYSMRRLFQIPNPLMTLISKDIPYLHQLGVWDVRYMHVRTSRWATTTLTSYQFAKMLWDPKLNVPVLLADYFRARYRTAARIMCDFYFHLERAMSNIMFLKADFAERFNRISKERKNLFIWEHLQLEPFHPALNDGTDLGESVSELVLCRKLLDEALASALPPDVQQKTAEDDMWFQYASNTMHFYYYMARTYTRMVDGDLQIAGQDFAEAEKYAGWLLEHDFVNIAHWPGRNEDALEATMIKPAYEWIKNQFQARY